MSDSVLLSICILTCNKGETVYSLINNLLRIEDSNFNIVVTDNGSIDNTLELLDSIDDKRLTVISYQDSIPALNCMIRTIFNGSGKYALYCNDRDLLFNDGIIKLINYLKETDCSFAYTTSKNDNSNSTKAFESLYSSLMNQKLTYHPTGMVFNLELIHTFFKEDQFDKYLPDIHTYCFLARELYKYKKTVILDYGVWGEKPRSVLAKNKSGTVVDGTLFFYPVIKERNAIDCISQINNPGFNLSSKERQNYINYCVKYFGFSLITYKQNLASRYMTEHYGIEKRFVSILEMIKIVNDYIACIKKYLENEKYETQLISRISSLRKEIVFYIIKKCIKYDLLYFILGVFGKDF